MGCEPAGYGFADLLKQGGGAFVALVGIVVTVAGLIGLKRYGSTGSLRQCTKGWKWTSSLAAWCVGQLLQLCAVKLASEPVITAVSTLAVPANALLAWKILGEPVTRKERLAIVAMTVGAGMVVVSSPQQARSAMTVRQEEALLTASVLPAIGLLVTLIVTQAG
jgi:drug/metabolite transporter (DMT)-like permease